MPYNDKDQYEPDEESDPAGTADDGSALVSQYRKYIDSIGASTRQKAQSEKIGLESSGQADSAGLQYLQEALKKKRAAAQTTRRQAILESILSQDYSGAFNQDARKIKSAGAGAVIQGALQGAGGAYKLGKAREKEGLGIDQEEAMLQAKMATAAAQSKIGARRAAIINEDDLVAEAQAKAGIGYLEKRLPRAAAPKGMNADEQLKYGYHQQGKPAPWEASGLPLQERTAARKERNNFLNKTIGLRQDKQESDEDFRERQFEWKQQVGEDKSDQQWSRVMQGDDRNAEIKRANQVKEQTQASLNDLKLKAQTHKLTQADINNAGKQIEFLNQEINSTKDEEAKAALMKHRQEFVDLHHNLSGFERKTETIGGPQPTPVPNEAGSSPTPIPTPGATAGPPPPPAPQDFNSIRQRYPKFANLTDAQIAEALRRSQGGR